MILSTRFDESFRVALLAIANIDLRQWPNDVPLHSMHESYTSDIETVESFCRRRSVFGRTSNSLLACWEALNYVSPEIFMYYLPAVLLAMLEHPRKARVRVMLVILQRYDAHFTGPERQAVEAVAVVLSSKGVTLESVLERIELGKQKLKELRKQL